MSSRSKSTQFEIGRVVEVPLHDATRTRFLNYAVSVITARALPDVRDGLKPVQRRILYTMHHDLHLAPEKPTIKCAKVVGQVLGNYHPHGDSAVYEAMVRMAQPWSLRYTLVFGQGNFGSIDGDGAAAYRYTEAKLMPLAMEFVEELGQDTVDFCPNFDDSNKEPLVLPTKVPQLLVNGSIGIAVGIATNIPPHNLSEVLSACEALIATPSLSSLDLMQYVKGPDFPTGGELLDDATALAKVYETGQGPIRMRGTYFIEEESRKGPRIVINSIPYMVNKAHLVEELGEIVMAGRLPQVQDVRDESTTDIRIVLECGKDTDPCIVMAYIFKHTSLQSVFHVNLTCLTPRGPERVSLRQALQDFVAFRFEVTVRRIEHEVRLLNERIHILEGFVTVFDALDEAIAIIRQSNGRKEAAKALMARFAIDEVQTDAVLDLRLYKLGRSDILLVREELAQKQALRDSLLDLLASEPRLWEVVGRELAQVRERFGDERRTQILSSGVEELSYQAEDFIVEEDMQILLTRDGWVRRATLGTDISKLRLRQDDEVVHVLTGSTLASVVFFTDLGSAYTMRVNDLPQSARGFGDPIQKFFNFADGEKVINVFVFDPRDTLAIESPDDGEEEPSLPPMQGYAVAQDGKGLRFSLAHFVEPSTKNGRKYARLGKDLTIVSVDEVRGTETAIVVSKLGHAILFPVSEVSFLNGPGRGVSLIKLEEEDRVLTTLAVRHPEAGIVLIREEGGRPIEVTPKHYRVVARGGKGTLLAKRGRLKLVSKSYEPIKSSESNVTPASPEAQESNN